MLLSEIYPVGNKYLSALFSLLPFVSTLQKMKYSFIATALYLSIVSADLSNYWELFSTNVNPHTDTLPEILQTMSLDEEEQCSYYVPDPSLIVINASAFPNTWELATSNGMDVSTEFTEIYNAINWSSAPDIPVRTAGADGDLNTDGYPVNDPDCWWTSSGCTVPKREGINADIVNCPEPDTYGLTYDDGPNCSHNAFYDYLQSHQLKASMFYIGSNVINWPYGALRGVLDGHHIASHTWSHNAVTSLTNIEVLAELYYTQKIIKLTTGLTPRYWRPPYGDIDDRVRWIATQLGMTAVMWDLDTDDWTAGLTDTIETVQNTYDEFIEMGRNGTYAQSGNIVLAHEINNTTMTLAIDNLPNITDAYSQVLDIASCHNISHPYLEDFTWTQDVPNNTTNTSSIPSQTGGTNSPTISSIQLVDPSSRGHSIYMNPMHVLISLIVLIVVS
ncbi:chitin deacetylase [Pilobolus umbonatus]|nr:chitin deacetylase [Pilobolus umbonatus]